MKRALLPLLLGLAAAISACGGSSGAPSPVTGSGDEGREAQVASVWRSKCGSCHVPIEPGARKRSDIETALQRHRKRLRLSDEQWTQMIDFLAPLESQQANAQ